MHLILFITLLPFLISAQDIPDSLYTGSAAIVLYENYQVEFTEYDKYTLTYIKSTKILNKKADHLQQIFFQYKDGSEKLSNLKISVLDANNNLIKKVKAKDIKEYASGDGYSIITDYRLKHWSYNTTNYPITITYSYKKESKNTLILPIWSPIPTHEVAVLESKYSLTSEAELRVKELNLEKYPTIKKEGNNYSLKNQRSLQKERYSPSAWEIVPRVILAPRQFSFEGIAGRYEDWSGYGAWMYESFIATKKLPKVEQIKKDLASIISAEDSEQEIIKKIYDFVQSNTRYISISLDEGGLSPMDPKKVHEVKYGDCKALSMYMKALLGAYDIKANYTEVHASGSKPQDLYSDFACPIPGNHIILNIPIDKDTVWLDCTSHSNPYNFLGTFTDDRQAISIEETGGKLVKTTTYNSEMNSRIDSITLSIDIEGSSKAEIITNSKGLAIQEDLKLSYKSTEEQEDHIKERTYSQLNIGKLNQLEIKVNEDSQTSKRLIDLELKSYAENTGDYFFIPLHLSMLKVPKLKKDKSRTNPIYFPRASLTSSIITIDYKGDLDLVEDPSLTLESKYGNYKSSITKTQNGSFAISRIFELNKGTYPAEEYNQIKNFFDQIIKSERTQITLVKK